MHILLIVGDMHPHAGGPPQVVAGSAAALVAIGHTVTIATLRRAGDDPVILTTAYPDLAERGVSILSYPADSIGLPGGSRAMRKDIAATIGSYDLMHAHGVWEGCAAQVAQVFRRSSKPVFVSAHGMLDRWSMAQSRIKKLAALRFTPVGRMLDRADAIVFGTEDERREADGVVTAPGVVVPNGVDVGRMDVARLPDTDLLRTRFPVMAAWTRTLLYFSRIHPKKGLDLLVDGMIELAPEHPGAGLLIVGIPQDAAYLAAIEARIASSGHGDRFALTTDMAGPPAKAAFRLADGFALPSHQEGFSMAIVEAMALGHPVLITDKCHLPEVESAGAGWVVPDDLAGITRGLGAMLALDPTELRAMGDRGRALVHDRYDWRAIAAELVSAYTRAGAPA